MKKYELTTETKLWCGNMLHRIRALISFGDVDAGDLGGWIANEDNLSQEGLSWVSGDARVYSNARVYGDARVYGNAWVSGDADIFAPEHVLIIGAIGSRNDFTTFFRTKNCEIAVCCGCFRGTIDQFLQAVQETHGDNKHAIAYRMAAELAKAQIDLEERK